MHAIVRKKAVRQQNPFPTCEDDSALLKQDDILQPTETGQEQQRGRRFSRHLSDKARRCRSRISSNVLTKAFFRRPTLLKRDEAALKKVQPSFSILNASRVINRMRKLRQQAVQRLEIFQVFTELEKKFGGVNGWTLVFNNSSVEAFHQKLDESSYSARRNRVLVLLSVFVFGPLTVLNANATTDFTPYAVILPIWLMTFYSYRRGRKHSVQVALMYILYAAVLLLQANKSDDDAFPYQLAILLYSLVPFRYQYKHQLCLSFTILGLYTTVLSSQNLSYHTFILCQIILVSSYGAYTRELHQRHCTAEIFVTGALAYQRLSNTSNSSSMNTELSSCASKYCKFQAVYDSLDAIDKRPFRDTWDYSLLKYLKVMIKHRRGSSLVIPSIKEEENDVTKPIKQDRKRFLDLRFSPVLEEKYKESRLQKRIFRFRRVFLILAITQSVTGGMNNYFQESSVKFIRFGIQIPAWTLAVVSSFHPKFALRQVQLSLLLLNIGCFMVIRELTLEVFSSKSESSISTGYLVMAYMLLFSSKIKVLVTAPAAFASLSLYVVFMTVSSVNAYYEAQVGASLLLLIILGVTGSRDQEKAERLDFMLHHLRNKRVSSIQKRSK